MVRTQIPLPAQQAETLRQSWAETRKSIAELVRRSVELYLRARQGPTREELVKRAVSAGMSSSGLGLSDVGVNHDRYLAEDCLK